MKKGIMAALVPIDNAVEIRIQQQISIQELAMVLNSALEMPGISYFTFRELGEELSWFELSARDQWPKLYSRIMKKLRAREGVGWSSN